MQMHRRMLILLVAVAAFAAACGTPVGLRTAPAKVDACDMALLAGELVASAQSGLAIRTADGTTEVLWPFGYSAAREASGLVLRDVTGKVVGHEGQRVQMSGGLGANNVWTACAGSISEVSNEGG
jgi:hypothetical protein